MKTISEQVGNRCQHFNGIFMNECCKAGVRYENVRVGKPYKFPCLKQGGHCDRAVFKTKEEVDNEVYEMVSLVDNCMAMRAKIIDANQPTGTIDCECGGQVRFVIAELNNHIHAKCNKCGISFNE